MAYYNYIYSKFDSDWFIRYDVIEQQTYKYQNSQAFIIIVGFRAFISTGWAYDYDNANGSKSPKYEAYYIIKKYTNNHHTVR